MICLPILSSLQYPAIIAYPGWWIHPNIKSFYVINVFLTATVNFEFIYEKKWITAIIRISRYRYSLKSALVKLSFDFPIDFAEIIPQIVKAYMNSFQPAFWRFSGSALISCQNNIFFCSSSNLAFHFKPLDPDPWTQMNPESHHW